MNPRERHEQIILDAALANDLRKGKLESFTREDDAKMVVITRESFLNLTEKAELLECLQACGVDNWEGYGDAQAMARGDFDE